MPNKSRKFRIVYTVTSEPLEAKNLKAAKAALDNQQDDLDEYATGEITNANVRAVLQEWVKISYSDEPSTFVWRDVA